MKIGILISGRGSNMVAIAEAVRDGRIAESEVVVVISDKANAPGLIKASEMGIEALAIERSGRSREEHDGEIIGKLKSRGVEVVCLAGYMRLLSKGFVSAFSERIINIHPSLLPDFPGLDAQKQAIEAGATESGCTVHFVDELLDHGPVILQKRVPVLPGDTPEVLSARILEVEHDAYVVALQQVISTLNSESGIRN